jgi:uncharacterized protein (TIGR02284 family)
MADHNERWVMNHLIEMCRDEERTLRYAESQARDPQVQCMFRELAQQRAQFAAELLPHAQRLGGHDAGNESSAGALRRHWVEMRDLLIGFDERRAIAEAEMAESRALVAYEDALDDMLPPTVRPVIEEQQKSIRIGHARVHALLAH